MTQITTEILKKKIDKFDYKKFNDKTSFMYTK